MPSFITARPIFSVPLSPRIGALPATISESEVILSGFSLFFSGELLDEFSEDCFEEPPLELPSADSLEGFPDEFDGEIVGFSPPKIARFPHSFVVK